MHRAELVEQSRQTRGCPGSRSQNEVGGGYDDEGDEKDLIGSGDRQFGGGSLGQPSSKGATRHQHLENFHARLVRRGIQEGILLEQKTTIYMRIVQSDRHACLKRVSLLQPRLATATCRTTGYIVPSSILFHVYLVLFRDSLERLRK